MNMSYFGLVGAPEDGCVGRGGSTGPRNIHDGQGSLQDASASPEKQHLSCHGDCQRGLLRLALRSSARGTAQLPEFEVKASYIRHLPKGST